jgi:8-hydroxy-5-deazaflavin:NADPH oxidoreductase
MRVAILGGTGSFGRALAGRLQVAGHDVVIGSRDPGRARELGVVLGVGGAANEEAVRGVDLVVLAVRSGAAVSTARELGDAIGTTPLLCVASDLQFTADGVVAGRESLSVAEEVAAAVPGPVASGLQSLSAVPLSGQDELDQDAFVCGDDPAAKEQALALAANLVAGRVVDAGPLANSRGLEGMTAVLLNVNRRYRTHAGLRLTGLP